MSSGEDFRSGDLVEVTVRAVVKQGSGPLEDDDRGLTEVFQLDFAGAAEETWAGRDLKLIERADDPSKDPAGTVRRSPGRGIWAKASGGPWYWFGPVDGKGLELTDSQVSGWEIIGAVPGTPAYDSWVQTQSVYEDGHAAGVADAMAKAAADELSRQQGDEERPFKKGDVVRHKGTGSVCTVAVPSLFHSSYYEIAPPWTGDGTEEPPAHVKKVQDRHGCVVERQGDGWVWATGEWARRPKRAWASDSCGPYTEVRS